MGDDHSLLLQSIIFSCTYESFWWTGLFQGFGALAILETAVRGNAANDLEVFII